MSLQGRHYPDPSRAEQRDMLLRLYYGPQVNLLGCILKGYLTVARTMHGVSKLSSGTQAKEEATRSLSASLEELPELTPSRQGFDRWHRKTCDALCDVYSQAGYSAFCIGQAQKWVNMSLKHIYLMGQDHVPGYESHYSNAHVPIDNVVLRKLRERNPPLLGSRWSRLADYEAYMRFQRWFRDEFPDSSPLAVEFWLWV